jgi:enoyl-CoA hydratase/carnithine racemase
MLLLPNATGSMNGQVLMELSDGLAWITLHHPGKRNAMSRAMWQQFKSAFDSISSPSDKGLQPIHCIIVRGDGGHFCAGGDISEYPDFRFSEASLRAFHEDLVAPALQSMLDCDVPLIAQIDGNCMGGGLEIAAGCDIRIAGQSATFGAPIAKLGLPMAPREAALVMRAVGELTAREMLLEARSFSAEQMQSRGFISQVLADVDVAQEVKDTAARIGKLSPQAARLNKQILRAILEKNTVIAQQNIAQAATQLVANAYRYADSREHREGVAAFMEKRQPDFLVTPVSDRVDGH